MLPHDALDAFSVNTLLIVPANREGLVMTALCGNMLGSEVIYYVSGIVFTGGIKPHPKILNLIKRTQIPLLLVEDDPNLGKILREYLSAKAYDVTLCLNGKEGLEAFRSEEFQFCILDVMMPILDGFALAKEIRKINQRVPLLFLTAKSMKEDAIEGFKLGADDYVKKPFSMVASPIGIAPKNKLIFG